MRTKIIIMIAMLLLMTSFASAADSAVLKTTLLRYEPVPAEPGDYITVYIQIENIGTANADSVVIKLKENYPFSVDDAQELEKNIGTLSTSQAYVTDFKVRVDDKAVSGTNDIKFEISDDWRNKDFTEKVFNINIQSRDSELNINNVNVEPSNLNPGKEGKISISLKNDAYSSISSISLQIALFDLTGASLPFAIKDGVSERNINILGVNEEKIIEYNIISYPDATPGIYKIPIILTYYDNGGTKYTKSDYITLIINPEPKISISIDNNDLTEENLIGDVDIKIINRGLGDIKFVTIKLTETEDYEILSSYDSIYLGNIDSDDYDTADFKIKIIKEKEGSLFKKSEEKLEIDFPISLTYKNSLNEEKILETTLTQTIYSEKYLNNGSSGNFGIIFVLILIFGGIAYWHFKKHTRKKK